MATYASKKGKIVSEHTGRMAAINGKSRRTSNNTRKVAFANATIGGYYGYTHFTQVWKGTFPLSVIEAKWHQMKKQGEGKVGRLGSLFG